MRATWRKQPSEQGLMRIGQSPRGAILKVGGEDVGRVYARFISMHNYSGWYWVARGEGVPLRNSGSEDGGIYDEIDDAKAACKAYVLKCLSKKKS